AKRIARVANLLALVAQQQPVHNHQNHPTHYTQNSSTRSQQAATRNRGKVVVNSPQPIYDQEPSIVAEDKETSEDKEIDKLMALISLSSQQAATRNRGKVVVNSPQPIYDQEPSIVAEDKEMISNVAGARETVETKRVKDATYHREKMLLCKQEEAEIQLSVEQADWRDHTWKIRNWKRIICTWHNFKSEHPEQSESIHDTYPIEQDEHNVIIDSLDMSYDREQNDDDADLVNE
nr:hypothetical protein [Tanacetum cinerariifolium]